MEKNTLHCDLYFITVLLFEPFYSDELSKALLLNLESFDAEVFAGAVVVVECAVTVVEAFLKL